MPKLSSELFPDIRRILGWPVLLSSLYDHLGIPDPISGGFRAKEVRLQIAWFDVNPRIDSASG